MELPAKTYWEKWDEFVKGQVHARGFISPTT